ncbi:MAG: hypothetical protein HY071_02225 [Chloroflexi bacterium]|nr:hypothetical protein [Chloroflexota bacterium]
MPTHLENEVAGVAERPRVEFRPSVVAFRDQKARYVGREVRRPRDFIGAGVFLEVGRTLVLVRPKALSLFADENGFGFLGELEGDVVWGSRRWKKVSMRMPEKRERGWRQVTSFDGLRFGVPGTSDQIRVDELRFRRLRTRGQDLLTIGRMVGRDRLERRPIHILSPTPLGGCVDVVVWKCQNMWCLDRCRQKWQGNTLLSCTCEDGGWCTALPVRSQCVNANCDGTCHQVHRWANCLCW